jgi:two-component system sensor histidine kinase and response regulator WspE
MMKTLLGGHKTLAHGFPYNHSTVVSTWRDGIGVCMSNSAAGGPVDPVMLELFRAEVDMHLPVLSDGLLALEKGRAGPKEIESMMRAAHSIKGAARIVGIEPAVRVAHVMEDCFTGAKEKRVSLSSDTVDVLLGGVDALQRVCAQEADSTLSEEALQAVLDGITAVRDGKAPAAPPASDALPAVGPRVDQTPTVMFPANVDESAAESLRAQLCDILRHKPARIGLNFAKVEQISASAVSHLLLLARDAKSAQPVVVVEVQQVTSGVRTLLRVVGLESAFVLND